MFFKSIVRCLVAIGALTLINSTYSKIINVPTDAASVQEAVAMAESGDEIVLSATEVKWTRVIDPMYGVELADPRGIYIKNKTLLISGMNVNTPTVLLSKEYNRYEGLDERNTMLWVENADVTFRHVVVETPLKSRSGSPAITASPWHIESGSLTLENCKLYCWFECKGNLTIKNSMIYGYSHLYGYAYTNYSLQVPTLLIGPADGIHIQIENSVISGESPVSYRNMVFKEVHNSQIRIDHSNIEGGTFNVGYGSYPGEYIYGSDAISFQNCHGNYLTIYDSIVRGGDGFDARSMRFEVVQGGGDGGNGIKLEHSQLFHCVQGETMISGGEGGNGLVFPELYDSQSFVKVESGRGGVGICLENSTLMMNECYSDLDRVSYGGKGGMGSQYKDQLIEDGKSGEPISLDESSSIVQTSSIHQWEVYD